MNKERKAQVVTVVVLVLALGAGLARKTGWRPTDLLSWTSRTETTSLGPQDVIYAMQNAARVGDVPAYLSNYTGQMEASLRQAMAGTTEAAFAKYLKDSNTTIRGIAVGDPQEITNVEQKVRVEYIYEDRNEAQTMYLEKGPSGWKISRVDSDERVKTLIPYGTPVK